MKKKVVMAGVVLIAVVAALLFRFGNSRDQNAMELSGTVEVTEINVGFKIPGRVDSLSVEEGDIVARGGRIAALDSAEYESLVNQGRASVRNAEAQFEKAKRDLDRYTTLHRDGVLSSQQMDAARTAYDTASSQLQLSQAALRTAEVRLKDSVINSPLNGVVLHKSVEAGETVSPGISIATVGDLEKPWIKVYVKEDKLGLVKLGQRAEVRVDSFPGKAYEGTVTYISSEAEFTPKHVQTKEERVKLVFGVKVSVRNENNELKPGMPADVRLVLNAAVGDK